MLAIVCVKEKNKPDAGQSYNNSLCTLLLVWVILLLSCASSEEVERSGNEGSILLSTTDSHLWQSSGALQST